MTLAHENDWYYNNYIMRLLIVEDENDLRNIVKKRLVKEHYSVDAVSYTHLDVYKRQVLQWGKRKNIKKMMINGELVLEWKKEKSIKDVRCV